MDLREIEKFNSEVNMVGNIIREILSFLRLYFIKKEKLQSKNFSKSEIGFLRLFEYFISEIIFNVNKEEDIVFVKSIVNSLKQLFYRIK